MQGVERIKYHCGGTGASQSRGDFAADVAGLSYAEHDNFPARVDCRLQDVNGVGKTLT